MEDSWNRQVIHKWVLNAFGKYELFCLFYIGCFKFSVHVIVIKFQVSLCSGLAPSGSNLSYQQKTSVRILNNVCVYVMYFIKS